MTALPPGVDPSDEIAITWEHAEDSTKVTAVLGEASIIIETSEQAAPMIPWLIAALPSILDVAWAAIEAEQEET